MITFFWLEMYNKKKLYYITDSKQSDFFLHPFQSCSHFVPSTVATQISLRHFLDKNSFSIMVFFWVKSENLI